MALSPPHPKMGQGSLVGGLWGEWAEMSPPCPTLLWECLVHSKGSGCLDSIKGPRKEKTGLPEGRARESPKGPTARGTRRNGTVDKSGEENLRVLERMPGYVDRWLLSCVLSWPGTSVWGGICSSEE